jgi:hypothetical protein
VHSWARAGSGGMRDGPVLSAARRRGRRMRRLKVIPVDALVNPSGCPQVAHFGTGPAADEGRL